ncbi:MAG: peptidoglycan-binding protein [Hyphomicrobiales bacterium]
MVRHEPTLDDHPSHGHPNYGHQNPGEQPYVYHRPARSGHPNDVYDDGGYDDGYDDDEPHGLIDRILAAPGKLAMTTVAVVAFAVVGVNAAYMQPGAHPAPMLSTRGDAPALAMPHEDGRLAQRAVTAAPAPIVPPSRSYDATASIPNPATPAGDDIASLLPRERYAAPAPTPRPQFIAQGVAQPATQPVPQSTTLPVAQLIATVPVETQPSVIAPRQVETIAVNDAIGALLAPVLAPNPTAGTNQPLPPSASTRSVQPVVAAVQAVLADMGYQPGSIDGVIGPSTEEAIRRFQLRRALEPNGQITNDLLREIERVSGTRISTS